MNWPQVEVRSCSIALPVWMTVGPYWGLERGSQFRDTFLSLQEWNPDATQTITRKEKPKKNEGGNTPNASGAGESTAQSGDRGR